MRGPHCCAQLPLSCREPGLFSSYGAGFSLWWLLLLWNRAPGTQASVGVTRELRSCVTQAELVRGMWDLPGPGIEPVCPALPRQILFQWSGAPVCHQVMFCEHFCVWRCIPDVSVERDVLHVHLCLRHPVLPTRQILNPWTTRKALIRELSRSPEGRAESIQGLNRCFKWNVRVMFLLFHVKGPTSFPQRWYVCRTNCLFTKENGRHSWGFCWWWGTESRICYQSVSRSSHFERCHVSHWGMFSFFLFF